MLKEKTLLGTRDKVADAIERLRRLEPAGGYYLCFSGGKDSQCIYHLAKEAGVKFDAHYNITGVDPPELVYFIREHYPDVQRDLYDMPMCRLIEKNTIPPSRRARYCCSALKEARSGNRFCITGVRWEESPSRRKNHGIIELWATNKKNKLKFNSMGEVEKMVGCRMQGKKVLNPIVDWKIEDVWEYLNSRNIPHCKLYDEGFKRLGCIGCPMGGEEQMQAQFERWPGFKRYYIRAFDKAVKQRKKRGMECQETTGKEMFDRWVSRKAKKGKEAEGQTDIWRDGKGWVRRR